MPGSQARPVRKRQCVGLDPMLAALQRPACLAAQSPSDPLVGFAFGLAPSCLSSRSSQRHLDSAEAFSEGTGNYKEIWMDGQEHQTATEKGGEWQSVVTESPSSVSRQATPITFFRTPASPPSCDPYQSTFQQGNQFEPGSIGVLEQFFVDLDNLAQVIKMGEKPWAGVIATSTRACEAWCEAAVIAQHAPRLASFDWSQVSLFVPGLSTAGPLFHSKVPSCLIPSLHPEIEDHPPGSASKLADFILSHTPPSNLPFLFLTGDKTLPDLPERLRAAGRPVTLRQVYETGERAGLREKLRKRVVDEDRKQWLVFFAPSSAQFVLEHLRHLHVVMPYFGSSSFIRLAAIGQTTATFLEGVGLSVAAVAERPTPASLLKAVQSAAMG